MNLLIVESPGKIKKIQGFLGSDWKVMASVGHVRDLPPKEMGVAAPDFRPTYVSTDRGKDVLAKLATAVKTASAVYLATDPDREGEAIAWHLEDALNLKNAKRITYTEITEKAVRDALAKARDIDMQLVAAQEGRRILDRFCGYMVSRPLSDAAGELLSAGRVQSPAVRLVVERERDIKAHKVTTHFGVELTFENVEPITDGWKAVWKPWLKDGEQYFMDKDVAEKVAILRTLTVVDFMESESRTAPPAPFTTSSLQQAASNALKMNPKKSMEVAQKLYEQGHITYMRTDSPNLSEEAIAEIRAFCASKDWPVVAKPRTWKSKDGAQEAHEAIRPTHIELEEAGETADEQALYALIRLRALACQLDDAVYAVRILKLEVDCDGQKAEFEARGRTLISQGWKVVTAQDQTDEPDQDPEADNPVPDMKPGQKIMAKEGKVLTKKTKPAARYTEASLVKDLEKRGIGRPSTYAAIMENITERSYVVVEKRQLAPTLRGEAIVDHLKSNFEFLDYDFTKRMEDELDAIAAGKATYQTLMATAYAQLQNEVLAFRKKTATPCPACQSLNFRHLVKKASKGSPKEYDFFACQDCKASFPNDNGKPGAKQEKRELPPLSEHMCPDCGKALRNLVKEAFGDQKGYNFWSCSGYPDCTTSLPDANAKPGAKKVLETSEFKCKKCKKGLIRRQGTSKKGEPYDFYGCSDYPKCKQNYYTGEDGKPVYEEAEAKEGNKNSA